MLFKWIQTIYGSLFSFSHGKFELTHNSLNFIWKHLHILSIENTPCWSVLPFNAIETMEFFHCNWWFFYLKTQYMHLILTNKETNGRGFDKMCFLTQFVSWSKFKLCIWLTLRSITAKYSKKSTTSSPATKDKTYNFGVNFLIFFLQFNKISRKFKTFKLNDSIKFGASILSKSDG